MVSYLLLVLTNVLDGAFKVSHKFQPEEHRAAGAIDSGDVSRKRSESNGLDERRDARDRFGVFEVDR